MRKAAKICSFFICRFKFFILNLHTCPGNPGTVPTTLSRGGEFLSASYRLPLSRQCFFMSVSRQAAKRKLFAEIGSRQVHLAQKIPAQKIHNVQTAGHVTGFIAIFVSGYSKHTYDPTHILPYPRHLFPADRHRTGRRHHPQCDIHGRLPRQHAGHSGARTRHESLRRDSPAGGHRLPRQGHFVPRPAGQSPETSTLNRRGDRSGTDFAHGA